MAKKVSLSNREQSLEDIATYYEDAKAGLYEFFSSGSQALIERHGHEILDDARSKAVDELGLTGAFSILAAVEAAIRRDYLLRVYQRRKDELSRALRQLHRTRGNKARLVKELIGLWREKSTVDPAVLNALVGAYKFRNWLAHGRYWTPKDWARTYDYFAVYQIAAKFINEMDSYNGT